MTFVKLTTLENLTRRFFIIHSIQIKSKMASSLENHCEIPEIKEETCVCPIEPSSFTISEKALEKLKSKKTTSNVAAREAILAEMEEKWLQFEKNMEDAHSKKWGYSKEHLDEMEERLLKIFDLLPPCPSEQGIVSIIWILMKIM